MKNRERDAEMFVVARLQREMK